MINLWNFFLGKKEKYIFDFFEELTIVELSNGNTTFEIAVNELLASYGKGLLCRTTLVKGMQHLEKLGFLKKTSKGYKQKTNYELLILEAYILYGVVEYLLEARSYIDIIAATRLIRIHDLSTNIDIRAIRNYCDKDRILSLEKSGILEEDTLNISNIIFDEVWKSAANIKKMLGNFFCLGKPVFNIALFKFSSLLCRQGDIVLSEEYLQKIGFLYGFLYNTPITKKALKQSAYSNAKDTFVSLSSEQQQLFYDLDIHNFKKTYKASAFNAFNNKEWQAFVRPKNIEDAILPKTYTNQTLQVLFYGRKLIIHVVETLRHWKHFFSNNLTYKKPTYSISNNNIDLILTRLRQRQDDNYNTMWTCKAFETLIYHYCLTRCNTDAERRFSMLSLDRLLKSHQNSVNYLSQAKDHSPLYKKYNHNTLISLRDMFLKKYQKVVGRSYIWQGQDNYFILLLVRDFERSMARKKYITQHRRQYGVMPTESEINNNMDIDSITVEGLLKALSLFFDVVPATDYKDRWFSPKYLCNNFTKIKNHAKQSKYNKKTNTATAINKGIHSFLSA